MSRRCDPADRIVPTKPRRPQGPQVTISMTRLATADIHDRQRTFQLFDELKAIILKFIFMYKILIHPSHPSESFIRVALRRAQGPPPAARSIRLGVGSRIAGHPGCQAGISQFQAGRCCRPAAAAPLLLLMLSRLVRRTRTKRGPGCQAENFQFQAGRPAAAARPLLLMLSAPPQRPRAVTDGPGQSAGPLARRAPPPPRTARYRGCRATLAAGDAGNIASQSQHKNNITIIPLYS